MELENQERHSNNKKLKESQQLIEACRLGDRKAQYKLYSMYAKAMLNVSMRILNDQQQAEDVLQESFLNVFNKMDSFRGESTIGAWIKRIVINKSLNAVKKKKTYFSELNTEIMQLTTEQDIDDKGFEYTIADVKRGLQYLSDGYRTVFSLFAFEGYSHKQIAVELNISESTSKSQYLRAKNRLKEIVINKNY